MPYHNTTRRHKPEDLNLSIYYYTSLYLGNANHKGPINFAEVRSLKSGHFAKDRSQETGDVWLRWQISKRLLFEKRNKKNIGPSFDDGNSRKKYVFILKKTDVKQLVDFNDNSRHKTLYFLIKKEVKNLVFMKIWAKLLVNENRKKKKHRRFDE
jgi:hypothetical protein